jgi:hypothetical protein
MTEPKGKLKIVRTELVQKGQIAVYVDLDLLDESGRLFRFHGSALILDLQEIKPSPGI